MCAHLVEHAVEESGNDGKHSGLQSLQVVHQHTDVTLKVPDLRSVHQDHALCASGESNILFKNHAQNTEAIQRPELCVTAQTRMRLNFFTFILHRSLHTQENDMSAAAQVKINKQILTGI